MKNTGLHDALAGCSSARLWFGNLNNGANAGARYLNLNNGLGNTRWNILPRLVVTK